MPINLLADPEATQKIVPVDRNAGTNRPRRRWIGLALVVLAGALVAVISQRATETPAPTAAPAVPIFVQPAPGAAAPTAAPVAAPAATPAAPRIVVGKPVEAPQPVVKPAPRPVVKPAPKPVTKPVQQAPTTKPGTFTNCAQLRQSGAAPIREGQPGYSAKLDTNHNGLACD